MNNLIFGNARASYYETICGGTGAGDGFAGQHCVHTHMTNTAITDPEILERRYPVRLRRFARRTGSGGSGQLPGGDGVLREIEFLEPMAVSMRTQHRRVAPYGIEGGGTGAPGLQTLWRTEGYRETLDASFHTLVEAGDRLVIETPGGGAWGKDVLEDRADA